MHKHLRGFTTVELIVVISLIAILLTMSVLGVRGMQASARDSERKVDVESIAIKLESMYAKERRNSSNVIVKQQGSYPPVIKPASSVDMLTIPAEVLAEFDKKSLVAPLQSATSLRSVVSSVCQSSTNCTVLSANMNTATSVTGVPVGSYVYIPFSTTTSEICTTVSKTCNSFKLYYVLERSPSVVQVVESKRR